jgi:hypothetical protein
MQAETQPAATSNRLALFALGVSQRYWRFVVVAMLVLLHVVALRGVADVWARPLLLAHLGLLLIWQPFLRGEHQVSATQVSLIGLGAAAVVLWLSPWLLVFWVCVLAGLVGGKVFIHQAPWQKRYYLLVVLYLIALLAIVILPDIAPSREISAEVRTAAEYGLPALFVALILIPAEPDPPEAPQVIDFFYSIFLMLVLGVVILGSFTFMTLGRMSYLEALTYTVFLISGTMFAIGLAWNPRTGFAGLNVFFSRYLFSIGLPLEKWLYFLAELSQVESRPERFLAEGVSGLVRLPWVSGAKWGTAAGKGEHGRMTAFPVDFVNDEVALTIYSMHKTSPALHWHLHLLGQLLAEFYVAKLRERKLQEQSYVQAVHETGARVTHDVKNLLQSLNVIVSMATSSPGREYSAELRALINRQLPVIAQRLSATLDKLQRPQSQSDEATSVQDWWERLQREYSSRGVEFEANGLRPGLEIPRSLADSVADNLLQNALGKRQTDPSVEIRCTLSCERDFHFSVCDSGAVVPAEMEGLILRAPVRSRSGLGIGLYQAARQAESCGYLLELESNVQGQVRFALSGPVARQEGASRD